MAVHRGLFRATGGKIGGRIAGVQILLLTTRGRKTGKSRTTPLMYLAQGEDLVLVASNGGSDRMPTWYWNLRTDPEVEVQIGKSKQRMQARPATAEERQELWPKVVAVYQSYDTYQSRTKRRIPLVILSPA